MDLRSHVCNVINFSLSIPLAVPSSVKRLDVEIEIVKQSLVGVDGMELAVDCVFGGRQPQGRRAQVDRQIFKETISLEAACKDFMIVTRISVKELSSELYRVIAAMNQSPFRLTQRIGQSKSARRMGRAIGAQQINLKELSSEDEYLLLIDARVTAASRTEEKGQGRMVV